MKKKRQLRDFLPVLAILGMLAGFLVLVYPTASDMWNRYRNMQLVTDYNEVLNEVDDSRLQEYWDEAVAFNENHRTNYVKDVFDEDLEYELSNPYDELLNVGGDHIMGYLEIPGIHVRLPIGHGVGEETLLDKVGHVEGTSLPVGGPSTHSVVSAHRGLPTAMLFTDLDQMQVGDRFYYHVLGKTLAYEVDKVFVVLPDEMDVLKIESGKDYSTLLTCTPYGVNTHRLIVRGERVPYVEEQAKRDEVTFLDQVIGIDVRVKILIGAFLFILVAIIVSQIAKRRKKRKQKK